MTLEPPSRRESRRLLFVFGALYFVQGVAEPNEGLIAQPVRSLLRSWGHDAVTLGWFATLLSIPWMIKPLYGMITDFVPIFGTRRKSWLVLWTFATSLSLASLWLFELPRGSVALLLLLMIVPTVGIAFLDVVVDALMVEEGQPRGLTGILQSVQWGAMYTATILTGWLGGYLSARGMQTTGFLICALTMFGAFLIAVLIVREPSTPRPEGSVRGAAKSLLAVAKNPAVLLVGSFLFLINFNPFGSSVTYVHMTEGLGIGEERYGQIVSLQAAAAVAAAATYGWICRRVPFAVLVHGSIIGAVAGTLGWWWLEDAGSAVPVAVFDGYMLMLASLVQLDIAARYCPPAVAATVFAILMSVCNLSSSLAQGIGGAAYTWWYASMGRPQAFALLVAVGAAFTALSWLLVPALRRLERAGPPNGEEHVA